MKKVETITTGSEKFKTPEKMRIYQATTSSYNKECPADSPYHVKREIIMSSQKTESNQKMIVPIPMPHPKEST